MCNKNGTWAKLRGAEPTANFFSKSENRRNILGILDLLPIVLEKRCYMFVT